MAFLHPILGALTVLFAAFVMSRGLASRQRRAGAHAARRTHRRWAPWALAAMVLSATTGTASTLALRDDLTLGETWHFAVGWTADERRGIAVVTVDDRGPGVRASDRERIFEPYVTSKETGTGLGLAISKKIALDHHGTLAVAAERAPTGGARFVLTVPLER